MNEQQLAAIRLAVECIEDAARIAGPLGAPSGVVYAALSGAGMRLETYQSLLDSLVRLGRITVSGHCIKLVGPTPTSEVKKLAR